ncbi:MBL fold metallo-hydrolase [Ancylomarina salipaludis]|uniref:MBL fold metallo-hydrolase n=2 Tax=Ancylomarina salipaludis TaxID=2501299 RepID=A0A4Q1JND8_9BACT|nr:MBL fold metallo-hydrolase [Ancylomarina salipaludis]
MWTILILIVALLSTSLVVFSESKYGKNPNDKRLERIKKSPNYKDGKFVNLSESPIWAGDRSVVVEAYRFFSKKVEYRNPVNTIPFVKTDLKALDPKTDILVWLGHSSYFMQIAGKKILVDPALSSNAAPFKSMNKAFNGTDWYKAENMPDIDYLIITHDHWDHLDYETVLKLKDRTKHIICPLGVGSHFEYWGFDTTKISELDWYEKAVLDSAWEIHATPARHYSGRGLVRNKTLWASFVLSTPSTKIFIGGDSGYDTFFAEIGNKFGPVDLAILELGQYHDNWKFIHTLPSQFFQAATDLKAKRVMPVHNSKFALGKHAWFDPLKTITELGKNSKIPHLTPMIGAPLNLNDTNQTFTNWWNDLR